MKNKFKKGEFVIVNGKGKISNRQFNELGIVQGKEYYYNEYLIFLIGKGKEEWFLEKDLKRVWERKNKKMYKYKVVIVLEKRGFELIKSRLKKMSDPKNNVLLKTDYSKKYKVKDKEYIILGWSSTYWATTNYSVECIQETLQKLREQNIAFKEIIIGETDNTYVFIDEFTDNDSNVNVIDIVSKIKINNMGGILI